MKSSKLTKIASATGILLGAFALSVLASSPWTAPTVTPPGNNVDAPINVGAGSQTKTGLLGLKDLIVTNSLQIGIGAPSTGQILTTIDTSGTVDWKSLNTSTYSYPTNPGKHTFCAITGIQYGWKTDIGNQTIYLVQNPTTKMWAWSQSGQNNPSGLATGACFDLN